MTGIPSFGIATYNYAPRDMINLAVHAERLGFGSLWLGEHYASPRTYAGHHPSRKETPVDRNDSRDKAIIGEEVRIYDPWCLIGVVAAVTSRIQLGTAICIVPMNHPLLLARQTLTAHDASEGRLLMGVGAGWLKEEFDAVGAPFAQRGSRLDESIEILRKAWAGGYFRHEGEHFTFDTLQLSPHPVSIPLICGGNTGPALRRVARVADGWINSAQVTLEEALALRDTIEAARKAAGAHQKPFEYYVRPHTADPEVVEGFVRAGFMNIVFRAASLWSNDTSVPLEAKIAQIEQVASELGVGQANGTSPARVSVS